MKTKLLIALSAITLSATSIAFAEEERSRPPRPSPEEIAADLIVNHDIDENNLLDESELVSALGDLRERGRKSGKMRRAKKDGSGPPDGVAPKRKMGKGGPPSTPAEHAKRMLARFDENGDGALNSEELLSFLDHMHAMRANRGGRRGPPPFPGDVPEEVSDSE